MTAEGRQATSASAATRSMSWWSMTAISPGRNRLVRFLVRRSTRATPPVAAPGHDLARSTARSPTRTEILIGTILPGPPGLARPTAPVLNTPSAGRDEVVTSFLTDVRPDG